MLMVVAPTLANVTVWLAEVVFTVWLPNSRDVVLRDEPTTDWTHPMHFHLVNVQIISRQPFDSASYNGTPEVTTPARLPDPDQASAAVPTPAPAVAEPPASAAGADSAADRAEADESVEVEISGYCMRCKTKRPIQNAHRETTESGRPAARGTCPVCGANMFTFLATDDDS